MQGDLYRDLPSVGLVAWPVGLRPYERRSRHSHPYANLSIYQRRNLRLKGDKRVPCETSVGVSSNQDAYDNEHLGFS